jgi:hypothetical protein
MDFKDLWLSTEDDKTWHITLDKYERDNLLALLNSIGFPANVDNPYYRERGTREVRSFNNGDWVGQIALKLMKTDGTYLIDKTDMPNDRLLPYPEVND